MSMNKSEDLKDADRFSDEFLIIMIAVKCLCMTLGMLGNMFVIIYNVHLRYERTAASSLVVNLAVSDILTCSVLYPAWIFKFVEILKRHSTPQDLFCKIDVTVVFIGLCVSTLTLTAITVDRYIFITEPLRHYTIMSRRKIHYIIIATWILALAYTPVTVLFYQPDSIQHICQPLDRYSISLGCLIYFIIPTNVILFLNYKMYRIAQQHRRRIAEENCPSEIVDTGEQRATLKMSRRILREIKVIKTFALVAGALLLCYTPLCVVFGLLANICHDCVPSTVIMVTADMAGINCVLNPFIYGITQAEYRKGWKRFLSETQLCP